MKQIQTPGKGIHKKRVACSLQKTIAVSTTWSSSAEGELLTRNLTAPNAGKLSSKSRNSPSADSALAPQGAQGAPSPPPLAPHIAPGAARAPSPVPCWVPCSGITVPSVPEPTRALREACKVHALHACSGLARARLWPASRWLAHLVPVLVPRTHLLLHPSARPLPRHSPHLAQSPLAHSPPAHTGTPTRAPRSSLAPCTSHTLALRSPTRALPVCSPSPCHPP